MSIIFKGLRKYNDYQINLLMISFKIFLQFLTHEINMNFNMNQYN